LPELSTTVPLMRPKSAAATDPVRIVNDRSADSFHLSNCIANSLIQ
jgi:hypothetical protein